MKKIAAINSMLIIAFIFCISCNKGNGLSVEEEDTFVSETSISSFSKTSVIGRPMVIHDWEGTGVNFAITIVSNNAGINILSQIDANIDGDSTVITSYLEYDKGLTSTITRHYTEGLIPIATLEYDKSNRLISVKLEEEDLTIIPTGLRSWWACTRYYYDHIQDGDGGMVQDVLCEQAGCKTLKAIASALYCMGLH